MHILNAVYRSAPLDPRDGDGQRPFPQGAGGVSAAIYTQWTDVETEVNGLLTYDRVLALRLG